MDLKNLKKTVQEIHNAYSPMASSEQSLLGQNKDDGLLRIIKQHTRDSSQAFQDRIDAEFFSWGPILELLQMPEIFEITINGPSSIHFESPSGFQRWEDEFLSALTFRNFTQRLCQVCKTQISLAHPFANGRFENFRLHIVGPPISATTTITLRRHQTQARPIKSYVTDQVMTEKQLQVTTDLVEKRANVLVIGNTGSGKTTLLNSLLDSLKNQRLIFIEDTEELALPNDLSVRLLTRSSIHSQLPEVNQQALLKQALRMRPDRIIMGEIRDIEAKDFLQALATGHEGSMGTLHANSAQQAIYRIEMMIQMGAPQWDLQAIRKLMQLSLSHIIVIQKKERLRRLEGIYRLAGLESFGFLLEQMA